MEFEPLFSAEVIAKRIKELGAQISQDYSSDIICVSVLKGSVVFFADLIRAIEKPVQAEFIGVKSYEGTKSTGHVQITSDLTADIKNKDVLIIEDIIDTGITMDYLLKTLEVRAPKSIEVCTLLSKPDAHILSHKIRYTGFEISNEFVIGYGLDYNGYYRNLPYIAQIIGPA
jgi:hypoxanthine phosphoribosyltransferase